MTPVELGWALLRAFVNGLIIGLIAGAVFLWRVRGEAKRINAALDEVVDRAIKRVEDSCANYEQIRLAQERKQ